MMDWSGGADASVVSTGTGSSADDVTVPEVEWDMMESSSPVVPYPVSSSPLQSGTIEQWRAGFMTYPSPDPIPSSIEMKPEVAKPEVATYDFRSAAGINSKNGADQSPVFTGSGSYAIRADDVTVPEVNWYTLPATPYLVSGSSGHPGFVTYPSPDPVPGTESTPSFWGGPFSEWVPSGVPPDNAHDHWLAASRWTTNEEGNWSGQIFTDKINLFSQQKYFDDLCPGQSLSGVIYESLEGASGVCWPVDGDYFEDVLAVMAKEADNNNYTASINGLA